MEKEDADRRRPCAFVYNSHDGTKYGSRTPAATTDGDGDGGERRRWGRQTR